MRYIRFMSKNRIKAILFDPASFPMPPAYTAYTAIEEEDHVLFIGMEKETYADDSMTVFTNYERGFAPSLPDGDYYLHARMLTGDDRYKIEFNFVHEESGTVAHTHLVDAKEYMQSFMGAFEDAVTSSMVDYNANESTFSKNYLRKSFAGLVEGNNGFWLHFYGDLDVATTPINLNMLREIQGKPTLPIKFTTPSGMKKPMLN